MSNPDRIIRDARLMERNRRNNPWSEPACLEPQLTDAQILATPFPRYKGHVNSERAPELDPRSRYQVTETREERIRRRLSAS